MSDTQCEIDGESDHDWKYVSDWSGDPQVIGGTFDCGYLECRTCGEENHSHPDPKSFAHEPDYYDY